MDVQRGARVTCLACWDGTVRRVKRVLVVMAFGLLAGPAGSAAAADSDGFAIEGAGGAPSAVAPGGPIAAPGATTVAFTVAAPAGAASTVLRINGNPGLPEPGLLLPVKGATTAFSGFADDERAGAVRQPTVRIRRVRLDGPGALNGLPQTSEAYYLDCVRDGLAIWGQQPSYQLQLAGGQSTRLLIDVDVPAGLATRQAGLTLTPTAWSSTVPATNTVGAGGTPGQPLSVTIPRRSGADAVSLVSKQRGGASALSGTVQPARKGAVVEIVARAFPRPKPSGTRPNPFNELATALQAKAPGQRRLARVRTDADGDWSARVVLTARSTVVARTLTGKPGASTAGASCPLVLRP